MNSFEKYILIVSILTSFFVAFLSSGVLVMVPSLAVEFGMNDIAQNWVSMIYLLAFAIMTVPAGQLSGKFGLKKSMFVGTIIFTLISVVSIFSISQEMFLICRLIQGLCRGLVNVASLAMVVSAFNPKDRGQAIGFNSIGLYLATALSSPIAGFLNTEFGWQSIFYVSIPFLIICILLIFRINNEWATFADNSLDIKGSIRYAIGIIFFIVGFTMLNEPIGIVLTVIGLIFIAYFAFKELKVKYPVFNVRLFKNPKFTASNIAALTSYLATFAITTIINYYLQYIRGMDSGQAGLILLITPLLQVIVAPIAGKLSDRFYPQLISLVGIIFAAIGVAMISFTDATTPLPLLMFAMGLQGFGFGLFAAPNTSVIMGSVQPEETPNASASVILMRVIGQSLSLGIFTLVISSIMGKVPIIPEYYPQLLTSCQVAAGICATACIVCAIAVFVGFKSKGYYDKG